MSLRHLLDVLSGCWWAHDGEFESSSDEMFLRCTRCGLRSQGVSHDASRLQFTKPTPAELLATPKRAANVVPFQARRRA